MNENHTYLFNVELRYHGYRLPKQEKIIHVGGPDWHVENNDMKEFIDHVYNHNLLFFDLIRFSTPANERKRFSTNSIIENIVLADTLVTRSVRSKSFADTIEVNINFASDTHKDNFLIFLVMLMSKLGISAKTVSCNDQTLYGGEPEPYESFPNDMLPGNGKYVTGAQVSSFIEYDINGAEIPGNQEAYFTHNPFDSNLGVSYGVGLLKGYLYHTYREEAYNLLRGLITKKPMAVHIILPLEDEERGPTSGLVYLSSPIGRVTPLASGFYKADISKIRREEVNERIIDFVAKIDIEQVLGGGTEVLATVEYAYNINEIVRVNRPNDHLVDDISNGFGLLAGKQLYSLPEERQAERRGDCVIL